MNYTYNLVPTPLPAWLEFDGQLWDTQYLTQDQLAAQGWLPLIYDPEGAPLGYADPVEENRDGYQVAVAYALGTEQERTDAALAAIRTQAHYLRRARRTEAELAGFNFSGHPLDSDRDSILRIANAAASAISSILTQQPWATAWRCKDEHDLPLDATGMLGLQAALAQHGQACHTASTTIGAEIDAAETQEEVAAIIEAIPTDSRWPA
jgi:hypothetical protein